MANITGTIPPGVLGNPLYSQNLLNKGIIGGGPDNDAMLYKEPIYEYGVHGPFNQTLFLGCSVTNFNVNLGWGAENSSLTVNLVRDDSPHWYDAEFQNNTLRITNNNLARDNGINTIPQTFNIAEPSPQSKLLGPGGSFNSPKQDDNVSDFNSSAQFGSDQYRNIYLKEQEADRRNKELNNYLSVANPPRPDNGKVYYELFPNGSRVKKFWTGPDPGFVGELYDILGTPVRFIFNDFEFIGVVTSWTRSGGSSSKEAYTVQIKSFASLLGNTQLIIDHYPGTIFTKFDFNEGDFYPPVFDKIQGGFGLPSNDIGNRYGRKDAPNNEEYLNSDYAINNGKDYVGTVSQGNIPNVFNIYGYLETTNGYGKNDINELGTKVSDITSAMKDLINKTEADGYTPRHIDTRFSPYGRIIGKAPAITKINQLNPAEANNNVVFLKDQYTIIQPQFSLISGIIEVPVNPNNPASQQKKQLLYSPGLEEYDTTISALKNRVAPQVAYLHEMGLLPCYQSIDGIIRQQYKLNIDDLPSMPSGYRIKGPTISIMQLITQMCDESGHDFFIDFEPSGNQIKVRTISRKQQPASNYIQKLISNTASANVLTSFDYGKETNDSATTRAMYIGAKQKRLLQLHSNFLANKNNGLVFDPYDASGKGALVSHDLNKIINLARIPDHYSTRNLNDPFYYDFIYNIGSGTGAIIWENYHSANWKSNSDGRFNCGQGNYLDEIIYKGRNFEATTTKGYGVGEHAGNPYGSYQDIADIFTDIGYAMYNSNVYNTVDINATDSNPKVYNMPSITVAENGTSKLFMSPNIYYNYPLWDDFISPYFGLDIDGTARKVYYDTGMRQIQVLCSIGDLQNRLGFALTSSINPQTGVEPWVGDPTNTNPNPTPPTEPQTEPDQRGQEIGQTLSVYNRFTQNITWNNARKEYYKTDSKFLLTENEIRAAMASMESWMEYTFNKSFTTDLGQILRKTIFANTGMVVRSKMAQTADQEDANKLSYGLDYPVVIIHNGPDIFFANSNPSENPTASKQGMYIDKVRNTIEKVYEFVKELGEQHYGKQFMVKIPGLSVSRDAVINEKSNFFIQLGNGEQQQTFEANSYEGGGRYYSNYKPSTDGAWEEIGNIIDDTIIVGSITGDFFRENDGKIGPILGYKASYEFLKDTIPDEELLKMPKPGDPDNVSVADNLTGKPLTKFMTADEFAAYTSKVCDDNNSPGGIPWRDIAETIFRGVPVSADPFGKATGCPPTAAMIYAQVSQPATGTDIVPNDWYPSLITQLSNQEYLLYPYNSKRVPSANLQSFAKDAEMFISTMGHTVPSDKFGAPSHLQYKLYSKAQIEPNYVPINVWDSLGSILTSAISRPGGKEYRAVLTLSTPVLMNPVHLVDKFLSYCLQLDANLFKLEGCSVPNKVSAYKHIISNAKNDDGNDIPVVEHNGTINDGFLPFSGGFGLGPNILNMATDYFLHSVGLSQGPIENKAATMPMAPKAAMPGFAAVPLESQAAVYGPWTNHPFLIGSEIFSNPAITGNQKYLYDSIENLVGGLKIEVSDELAPWQYGGMKALDANIVEKIQSDASYQLEIEYGNIDVPGAPIYRLGDFLDKTADIMGGPIVNNISANIDTGGVSTKYAFRTYSKKFGLYNKESADRLQKISQESILRRRELALRNTAITNESFLGIKKRTFNEAPKTDFVNRPLSESWRSASELLVGHNEMTFRLPDSGIPADPTKTPDVARLASGVYEMFPFDYNWPYNPVTLTDPSDGNFNVVDFPKIVGQTKLMDSREADSVLTGDYENTSMMSLDGILSPISYYPTDNAKTYHITKYPREQCRYCYGLGKISYKSNQESAAKVFGSPTMAGLSYNGDNTVNQLKRKFKEIDCPFCEPDAIKASKLLNGSSRGRATPPFILTNTKDIESVSQSNNKGNQDGLINIPVGTTTINYSTLNPVILPFGEFSAFQNRQSGDYTGHCIKMVAQGTMPPWKPNDSLNIQYCGSDRLFKSFLEYDQLYLDMVNGIYSRPPDKRTETEKQILINIGTEYPRPFRNNSRFFGLRGPLMLHSWGYDTEGYPVPNSSGELQYITDEQTGKLKPFVVTLLGDEKKKIYVHKNQRFIASGTEPTPYNVTWVTSSGTAGFLTDPYKEHTFARGWAQLPSTWPVGPIDLRWDENARVWSIPSTFKNVYVLLEEDLNNNIARGQLVDNNSPYNTNPLPVGYRKVVFVRDTLGVYRAPRSAIIYCAYDSDSGYYEPISQSSFTTSGTIISANTASMYKIYQSQASNLANNANADDEPVTFVASFSNPLDVSVYAGDMALFTYLQNGWIVQAARG